MKSKLVDATSIEDTAENLQSKTVTRTRYYIEQRVNIMFTRNDYVWRQRTLQSLIPFDVSVIIIPPGLSLNDDSLERDVIDDRRIDHARKVFAYACKRWPKVKFRLVQEQTTTTKTVLPNK